MSGMSQQEAMALWQQAQAQQQAPGANGGGFQTQQAPGAGGGGMGIEPVPMMQPDPAYGQQPQFQMPSAPPQVNGVHSNGLLGQGQIGNTRYGQQRLQMDPAYRGQAPMPAQTSRAPVIGRVRGR